MRVEPITRAWADALAQGDDVFSERFRIAVEPGWEGFPEAVAFLVQHAHGDAPARWGPHLVFDDDGALVGNGGWKGAPVDGVAEVGYAVAPARQGRGIATGMVRQMLDRARAAGVRQVIAHTLAERSASTSVLTRCGFEKIDERVDPEDGPVWLWRISLEGP